MSLYPKHDAYNITDLCGIVIPWYVFIIHVNTVQVYWLAVIQQ
jgi:hypothetical protein